MTRTDFAVFAPHPDDAELSCGGLLIKLAAKGYATAVVDMTRGELGTRGDADTRATEAAVATKVLGLAERINLGLPDGALESYVESRRVVAQAIRTLRPTVVALPYWKDNHPDHYNGSRLVYEGVHLAGLKNGDSEGNPFRVRQLLYYMGRIDFTPSLVVDVTTEFEKKFEAVRTYESQLYKAGRPGPETDIGSENFLRRWEARHTGYGAMIGTAYGEPYFVRSPLRVDDPVAFFAGKKREGTS